MKCLKSQLKQIKMPSLLFQLRVESTLKCLQHHLRIFHKRNLRQQSQFSEDVLTSILEMVNRPSHNSQASIIQVTLQVS